VPFYAALSIGSLLILIVLVWFVLIPGIRAQQSDVSPAKPTQSEEVKP